MLKLNDQHYVDVFMHLHHKENTYTQIRALFNIRRHHGTVSNILLLPHSYDTDHFSILLH